MFRHDVNMAKLYPKYYEEILCVVCKKARFAVHKDRNGTRTCSMKCARLLNDSSWRYRKLPEERKKQIRWQSEYKKRKRAKK